MKLCKLKYEKEDIFKLKIRDRREIARGHAGASELSLALHNYPYEFT